MRWFGGGAGHSLNVSGPKGSRFDSCQAHHVEPMDERTRVSVIVHPRASRSRHSWDGQILEVWVNAPPLEGAANDSVVRLIAAWLDVPRSRVSIVSGQRSRTKIAEISGPVVLPRGAAS